MRGILADWNEQSGEIARQQKLWKIKRKYVEERVVHWDNAKRVRDWIKHKDDPEPAIDTIRDRVMPGGNYSSAGQWFLKRHKYKEWSRKFLSTKNTSDDKRFLWLHGTYGSGKTTIMYRTYLELMKEQRIDCNSGTLQIVPYFCFASGSRPGPNYETILRALIWHISLPPGHSLASCAQESFYKAGQSKSDEPATSFWEGLFHEVLQEVLLRRTHDNHLVFVIDALDECVNLDEANKLVQFIADEVLSKYANIHFLCSSQKQVDIDWIIGGDRRVDVAVETSDTDDDMKTFINCELDRRRSDQSDSQFCK